MKCNIAVMFMHDYLDGDLPSDQTKQMLDHLQECGDCRTRYEGLERMDALVRTLPTEAVPADLNHKIMSALPKSQSPAAWTRWVRRHPAASAAALFLVVMLSSFVAMWNQSTQMTLSGSDLEHVVIDGNKVIVPAGQRYTGNLTVTHGIAEVQGDLDGNLTVIDGSVLLASTAHIAGEIKEIDRAVDWFWYKVSSWFGSVGTLAYGR